MKNVLSLAVTLLILALFITSCAKTTDEEKVQDSVYNGTQTLKPLYPHYVEFKATNLHGKYYYSSKAECKKCHGDDLLGGESRVSCNKCHTTFPHSQEFFDTNLHGTQYLLNYSACIKCHKPDNNRELTGVNCKKCHNYPHSQQWAMRENHGQGSLSANESEMQLGCSDCHAKDSDFRSRYTGLPLAACDSCHIDQPHTTDFKDGEHSGLSIKEYGQCLNCHTDYKRLMPNYEECTTCHDGKLTVQWGE